MAVRFIIIQFSSSSKRFPDNLRNKGCRSDDRAKKEQTAREPRLQAECCDARELLKLLNDHQLTQGIRFYRRTENGNRSFAQFRLEPHKPTLRQERTDQKATLKQLLLDFWDVTIWENAGEGGDITLSINLKGRKTPGRDGNPTNPHHRAFIHEGAIGFAPGT